MSKTIVGASVLGVGLLALTMLQAGAAPRSAAAPAAPGAALLGPRAVAAEGRVVAYPGYEVTVSAERAGRLVALRVHEGDAVRRGQLVAELESDELRAALDEARARVSEAQAELRLSELERARKRQLTEERVASARDLDQAVRDLEIAQARLETARATVTRIEAQLAKTRVLAPLSGQVVQRYADAGETVEAGQRLVTVADLSRLRVEAEADEADAGALRLGQEVRVTSDGYPGRSWRGRVEEIPDSVTLRRLKPQDPSRPTDTRVLAVKVAFQEENPLKLGTTVELRIEPHMP